MDPLGSFLWPPRGESLLKNFQYFSVINNNMEQNIVKVNGGARPGAGRPKGGTNKISAVALIEGAERIIGKPFIDSLLEGYKDSILNGDRKTRVTYEKLILDKIISDKQEVEVINAQEAIDAKTKAFAEAMAELTNKNNKE